MGEAAGKATAPSDGGNTELIPRGYYAYEEGLSPFDDSKSVEFVFDIIRPNETTTKAFRYKASGEDAIDGTLSTLFSHLYSNLEPIVFRSFYFIGTTSTLPPSAIFERDIRFLDLAAWGNMTSLQRPDQFKPKNAKINEVVNNLINEYGSSFNPDSKLHHYVCPLNETNAKLLANVMPIYFADFANYVRADNLLSAEQESALTDPNNWIAVYDPAVITTKDVVPSQLRLSGHDIFKANNQDFPNEPFCVQSDWVVRYVAPQPAS